MRMQDNEAMQIRLVKSSLKQIHKIKRINKIKKHD